MVVEVLSMKKRNGKTEKWEDVLMIPDSERGKEIFDVVKTALEDLGIVTSVSRKQFVEARSQASKKVLVNAEAPMVSLRRRAA